MNSRTSWVNIDVNNRRY